MRRFLMVITLFLVTCTATADDAKIRAFVDNVAHSIIATVSNKQNSVDKVNASILSIIQNNFDVAWMSRFALGKNYKVLSDQQVQEYVKLYEHYLLASYSPILRKYNGQFYNITKIAQSGAQDYDVDIKIMGRDGSKPVSIKYHIKEMPTGEYRAMDMVVEGVSTISTQRSEFSDTIQTKGVDGLFSDLRAGRLAKSQAQH